MKNKIRVSLVFAILIFILLAAAAFAATRLGVLDFIIGRYAEEVRVLPSATDIIQENFAQAQAHTKYADFSVRQAVFDGQAAYVVVAATPADKNTLLLGTDSGLEMPVSDFGPRFADDETTIADYAEKIGAQTIAFTGLGSTDKSDVDFDTFDYMLEEDGTLVYMAHGVYEGSKNEVGIEMVCLTFDAADDESIQLDEMDRAYISFGLKAAGSIGEAVSEEKTLYADCGVVIDEVKLSATPMAVYTSVYFSVVDKEKFDKTDGGLRFEFVDEKGERLPSGATAGGSLSSVDGENIRFVQTNSLSAMERLPGTVMLRGYNCWENNLYETHEIALK